MPVETAIQKEILDFRVAPAIVSLPGMTDFIVNIRSKKIARTQYSFTAVLEHSRGNPWIFFPRSI